MSRNARGGEAPGGAPLDIEPYAYDDELVAATRADGRTRVAVYAFPRTVAVLGRGSDPDTELQVENVRADDLPVLRRRGGGCAVVLDPGNVIVTVAVALPGLDRIRTTFDHLTAWIITGLERAGVPDVVSDGVSDLVIGDRKVAGSCVHRALGLFTYSASLLVAPNVDLMTRYLAHPPREPEYRRRRAHEAFVASISDHWPGWGEGAELGTEERASRIRAFANALEASLTDVELD